MLRGRVLINAAGPWVENVMVGALALKPKARVRLVQGSHVVVRKLYEHDRAYILQNPDGRIVFAIPFEREFTLIGTTDRDYDGDPARVSASPEEIDYLCRAASENFAKPITVADVVWSYSGVRPLYDDGASEAKAATRDYVLETDAPAGAAPVISIFGGKITTYRRLAEEVLKQVERALPMAASNAGWTARAPLPGGDFPVDGLAGAGGRTQTDLSLPLDPGRRSDDPRLWHARPSCARIGEISGGSGHGVRRHADGSGGALPGRTGVGAVRRGHCLAPLQARPTHDAGGSRFARRLDGHASPEGRGAGFPERRMTIALDHVWRTVRGEHHIRDLSVTFEPGTINILLGPTLSGKTTTMRLLAGLDPPTSGRVLASGRDVTGVAVRERSVAMVYQQFINYPSMTVYENIASPLRVRGAAREEIDRRVREAAALLRLEPYLERMALSLSGGQQQRTALARALVKDASLVLLDEPLANLDYKLREELRVELPRIFAGKDSVIVYATTEPTEALLLGGHTATLNQGEVTQFGPTPFVYRNPKDRITAQTFSDPPMNFLQNRASRGRGAQSGWRDVAGGRNPEMAARG